MSGTPDVGAAYVFLNHSSHSLVLMVCQHGPNTLHIKQSCGKVSESVHRMTYQNGISLSFSCYPIHQSIAGGTGTGAGAGSASDIAGE